MSNLKTLIQKTLQEVSADELDRAKEYSATLKDIEDITKELGLDEAKNEMNIFGYQTQFFHICPAAISLFNRLLNEENPILQRKIKVAAQLADVIFKIESISLERNEAYSADLQTAKRAATEFESLMIDLDVEIEDIEFMDMHIEKIADLVTNPMEEKLDPVGKEDADINNDGKVDSQDKYLKNRREKIAKPMKEDLDIGHIDDEAGMLKQTAFEIAEYAAKLYKLLKSYEDMPGEVDFPNWWQASVIKARENISKATHYLEFETKEPALDAMVTEASDEKFPGISPQDLKAIPGYDPNRVEVDSGGAIYVDGKFIGDAGSDRLIDRLNYDEKMYATYRAYVLNKIEDALRDLDEKLTKRTPMGKYIEDFEDSDAPQFKGKSKAKRRQMAIAAKLSKMDENVGAKKYLVNVITSDPIEGGPDDFFDDIEVEVYVDPKDPNFTQEIRIAAANKVGARIYKLENIRKV